ncbi:hypothetical protein INP83_03110 [Mucilaginibacter sp. 21P]|uniref:hypothetical protein n=1 Tax=Mucilaginibacter sp. 21P TaxID=2778902 RepID=UPI001C57EBF6|nr:hypothetical protein [Mucilaginibacter sp. 21P]QXV66099.1 hypothetical protein INP83_03110 [Mucilaginibacter sp. 21P]
MPTIQFQCPLCQKQYRAYVDHSTMINCHCGTPIKPTLDGNANVVDTKESQSFAKEPRPQLEAHTQPNYTTTQSGKKKKDYSILAAIILGIFAIAFVGTIVGSIMDWYNERQPKNIDIATQPIYSSSPNKSINSYSVAPSTSDFATAPSKIEQSNTSNDPIVYVHILNTFLNTNKHVKSIAVMDEKTNTITLTAVDNPKSVIKMIVQGQGVVNVQFFNDGKIEADKIFFRRPDLEKENGSQIYTSRTGEITITLSLK